MNEKHFFAGNNTSLGFFSYFDHILKPEDANHRYILKGGPGVGKSSFMKKFAKGMTAQGHTIEYIHCSSDNSSLDAIVVENLKIALMDGTSPHIVDPKYPGVVDEIINLGQFLDSKRLAQHRQDIIDISKEKSGLYRSAYHYLEAAGVLSEEMDTIYDGITDYRSFNHLLQEVVEEAFPRKSSDGASSGSNPGRIRKLFTEAYTSDGYISYTDSLCSGLKVWLIRGEHTNLASALLEGMASEAIKNGYQVEGYYRPLTPRKLQHIFIQGLNLLVRSNLSLLGIDATDCNTGRAFDVSDNRIAGSQSFDVSGYQKIIDLQQLLDQDKLLSCSSELDTIAQLINSLVKQALARLARTRERHGDLEQIYIDSMDFKGVDDHFDYLLSLYL